MLTNAVLTDFSPV